MDGRGSAIPWRSRGSSAISLAWLSSFMQRQSSIRPNCAAHRLLQVVGRAQAFREPSGGWQDASRTTIWSTPSYFCALVDCGPTPAAMTLLFVPLNARRSGRKAGLSTPQALLALGWHPGPICLVPSTLHIFRVGAITQALITAGKKLTLPEGPICVRLVPRSKPGPQQV